MRATERLFDKLRKLTKPKTNQTSLMAYAKVIGIGLFAAVLANVFLQWSQNGLDHSLVYQFAIHWHTELFMISTAILFMAYLWLTTATGSKWMGGLLLVMISSVMGFATFHKMTTQQEPFYPNDLKMIGQIPFLFAMLSTKQQILLVGVLGVLIVLIYMAIKRNRKKKSSFPPHKKRILRVYGFVFSTFVLIYVGLFNQPGNKVRAAYDPYSYWIPYSQQMNYYNNGFVGGFLYNLNFDPIERPQAYSKSQIQKITQYYTKKAKDINASRTGTLKDVNVVFIMNESFSDPLRLKGITASEDPIPFTRELQKRSSFGYSLAPSIGGGTANSEFEALTGVSIEPLAPNVSSPYTQIEDKLGRLPHVLKHVKKTGHQTTAIHPFNTSMYKRKEVYPEMGFDTFLFDKTMTHTDTMTPESFISDQAAYEEVWRVLKETEGKDFIHLVTMQNHMPYANKYATSPYRVQGSGNQPEAEAYFQDLAHSDEAMKYFVEQLDAFEEETIVVFWGDHLPGFYADDLQEKNTNQEMYETPLLIFSNRNQESKEIGTMSPLFFFNHVLEKQNAPITAFQALQMDLETHLPAFEKNRYKEGNVWKNQRDELSPETRKILESYTMVLYDTLGGEQFTKENGFFDTHP